MPAVINTPAQQVTSGQVNAFCTHVRDFSYGQAHEALTKLRKSGRIDRDAMIRVLGSNGRVRNLLQEKITEIVLQVANEQSSTP